jgi:hypothetical protein
MTTKVHASRYRSVPEILVIGGALLHALRCCKRYPVSKFIEGGALDLVLA